MLLFNRAVTAGCLALLGAYFLWWRLSEYAASRNPSVSARPVGPAPHSLDGRW
jgi:hypothetical protein